MNVFDVAADHQWTPTGSPFRGAELNRLSADVWNVTNHPDNEIRYAARTLRARARDMVRNNPYAAGVVDAFADNIIGEAGIKLRPKITLPDGEPNRRANQELVRGWSDWGEEYASVDEIECWYEIERLIAKTLPTDGEVFIRHRSGWDNPYAYAVELIDPDLLDETYNERREERGREIVMGVEIDEVGRPLAYHFWKRHPGEVGHRRERVRIPAEEITHFFVRYRPGQTRGYSWFAPVLTTVEMVDGYSEAELVAARMQAAKMGFITNNEPEAIQAYATRLSVQNEEGKGDRRSRRKVSPGTIDELLPGQGFASFDPNHPNEAFDDFLKVLLRGVARGFGVSYGTLTGDISDANYSSMRAGLLPERDHWRVLQNITAKRVHGPIYRRWLRSALLTGELDLMSPIAADYHAVEWRGRRWPWVDPSNDLEAFEREVKLGINSRQRGAADRGLDYETVIDETREDLEYAREQGVDVSGMGSKTRPAESQDQNQQSSNGNGNGRASGGRLAPYTVEAPDGN